MGDTLYAATRRGTVYRIVADSGPRRQPVGRARLAGHRARDGGRTAWCCWAAPTARSARFAPDGSEAWRVQLWLADRARCRSRWTTALLAVGGDGDLHRYRR